MQFQTLSRTALLAALMTSGAVLAPVPALAQETSEPPETEAPAADSTDPAAEPMASQAAPAPADEPVADETDATASSDMTTPAPEMQQVLDKLAELGAKPIHTLSVEEARSQPTPADAVMAVMEEEGIQPGPAADVQTEDITIPGPAGDIPARVYTPAEGEGPFPVIVYYHGGGWVIANIDTYDASARALAHGANAIVVSSHYRQAPENTFPAAHEDAYAAYTWVVENAGAFNGDSSRIAVAGESAGGNLAANVAIRAMEEQVTVPVHQLLVYPVAGNDMMTESYIENADAMPLGKADMEWFVDKVFEDPQESADPRIDLVSREDLEGLPPATVITAEIDPLRSEGMMYADNLEAAGVDTAYQNFEGVTHEFFGMGAVIPQAMEAVDFATGRLTEAFGSK